MGIHNVYLNKEIENQIQEEIADRRAKGEMIAGKLIGKSHIIQDNCGDRARHFDKRTSNQEEVPR